jgi:serine/threonine protein kinase/tetratricopeptide (TPR) repeat protein
MSNSPERHQQVMSVLADALECDVSERETLLAYLCAEDEPLRLEVLRLLSNKARAQDFMEQPLVDGALCNLSYQEESVIGRRIGPYLIISEIGRGGMGAVFLAKRSDDEYQRQVAIKLIKPGMDSDLVQRRFRNERQILANLNHPNIARLFDGGTTEDGRAFLVMEYISGQPIDVYADAVKLLTSERLKLFLPVCDAVQYAHRNKVIHRDLKPSNILVNEEGIPKLLDFGIARFLDADQIPATAEATTSAGRILTPEYASPEQIRGDQSTVASDIYSLGAVLYELLTGHRPRRANGRGSSDEMPRVIATRDPEKPSSVINRLKEVPTKKGVPLPNTTPQSVSETRDGAPEKLRRRLRGDLDNIVLKALRKDPRRRYDSVDAFSHDLRRHLQGQPVQARKDSLVYRSQKFFQRNRTTVVSAAVVAVLCFVIGLSLNRFIKPTRPTITSIGVMPFVNVGNDPETQYLADGLTSNLISYLSRLPNLRVPGYDSVSRYQGQAIDPAAAAMALQVNTVMLGSATTIGGTLSIQLELIEANTSRRIWSRRFEGKVSGVLLLQQQIAQEVALHLGYDGADARAQRHQPTTQSTEAYKLYLKGNQFWNLREEPGFTKAIQHYEAAIGLDPNYSLAYSGLANSYSLLGAYRILKPEEAFPKAKSAALKAIQLDGNSAEGYASLALVSWLYDWDWAAADQAFRRSIELNPGYVTAHHWYGLYLGEMGRFEEALASEQRALDKDPLSVYVNADLGRVYFYARRYEESLVQYRKTTEMGPNFGAFYAEIGQLYEQTGMLDKYITEAHPDLKEAREFRLLVERARKSYLEKLWLIRSKPIRQLWWSEYCELARMCARLGKRDEAFRMLERVYQVRDHFMTQLKVDPAFDSLRSDPRFEELLHRMNLTP